MPRFREGLGGGIGSLYDRTRASFTPNFLWNRQDQSALPPWLNQNPNQGSLGGLRMAQNAGRIGTGLGLLTGIPGLGMAGGLIGDSYINNHVFQSPAPQQPGPFDAFNNAVSRNNPNTWGAQQSPISPRSIGSYSPGMSYGPQATGSGTFYTGSNVISQYKRPRSKYIK